MRGYTLAHAGTVEPVRKYQPKPRPIPQFTPGDRVRCDCEPPVIAYVRRQERDTVWLWNPVEGEFPYGARGLTLLPKAQPLPEPPEPQACCREAEKRARGLCGACYRRWWASLQVGQCSTPGCSKQPFARGQCNACYNRHLRASKKARSLGSQTRQNAQESPESSRAGVLSPNETEGVSCPSGAARGASDE